MIGKIVPYITVGYIQVFLILLASKFLFNVPIVGSVPLLLVLTFFFIVANLAVGITFSTIAKNQLQAVQMECFSFSCRLFVVRLHVSVSRHAGLGAGHRRSSAADAFSARRARDSAERKRFAEIAPDLWPIALFLVVMLAIGIKRYRQTLDYTRNRCMSMNSRRHMSSPSGSCRIFSITAHCTFKTRSPQIRVTPGSAC
jgi:ABC-2 type transport system permease protein